MDIGKRLRGVLGQLLVAECEGQAILIVQPFSKVLQIFVSTLHMSYNVRIIAAGTISSFSPERNKIGTLAVIFGNVSSEAQY